MKARTTALATAVQALFAIVMSFAIPYMVNPDEGNLRGKAGFVFWWTGGYSDSGVVLLYSRVEGENIWED